MFFEAHNIYLAPSDEGAVEQSETEGEKRLRFYATSFLSLRLFAYAKSHLPRQREAGVVAKASSLQTPIYPSKSKQARQKPYFYAFAELVIFSQLIRIFGYCVFNSLVLKSILF